MPVSAAPVTPDTFVLPKWPHCVVTGPVTRVKFSKPGSNYRIVQVRVKRYLPAEGQVRTVVLR